MGQEQGKEERVPELQGKLKNEVHGKRRHLQAQVKSLEILQRTRAEEETRVSGIQVFVFEDFVAHCLRHPSVLCS